MILRQTTRETLCETGAMPAGTGVLIFAPFLHRDDERLPDADRFAPELWLDAAADGQAVGEGPATNWPLGPFGAGPAFWPGRNLALLPSSTMLAAVLDDGPVLGDGPVRVEPPARLDPHRPLPATFDNYTLRFALDR